MDSGNQPQSHDPAQAIPQPVPHHQQPYPAAQPYHQPTPQRGNFLSLRLIAAVGISVILAILSAQGAEKFIHTLSVAPDSSPILLLNQLTTEPTFNVTALLVLAALPWFLFKSVKRSLSAEPGFTKRAVYKVTMYTGLSILVMATAISSIGVVSTLISSLAYIGTSLNIGMMYLNYFLPQLLATVITGFSAYCLWQTAKGKDMINLLSIIQAAIAGVVAVALLVALIIAAHRGGVVPQGLPNAASGGGSSLTAPKTPTKEDIQKLNQQLNEQSKNSSGSSNSNSNEFDEYLNQLDTSNPSSGGSFNY